MNTTTVITLMICFLNFVHVLNVDTKRRIPVLTTLNLRWLLSIR